MSIQIGKYTPLKTIVSYILDANDKDYSSFDKCWILAFRALMDVGFNVAFEPKSVRLLVDGNNTVRLPGDYISWTKIGCLNGAGEVSTLKINNSLTKIKDTNPNRLSALAPDVTDAWIDNLIAFPYFVNYYSNGGYSPLFGLGGGLVQYGECTVDEKNGIIVMSPNYSFSEIVLEYISSPQQDNDYVVDTACQEAVIAFVEWKLKLGSEQAYYSRLTEARRRLDPVRLQEANQAIRQNQKYAVKA